MLNQALIAAAVIVAMLVLPLFGVWISTKELGDPEDKPPAGH
jgi:hypothetical protein